jgi:hypothetical protein
VFTTGLTALYRRRVARRLDRAMQPNAASYLKQQVLGVLIQIVADRGAPQ